MTTVVATLAPGRSAGAGDFADLTPVRVIAIRWVDGERVAVDFDGDLPANVVEAVEARLRSVDADEESLQRQALEAYRANRDYLAVSGPSTAQVVGQVAALTRQVNALIRLLGKR